MTTTSVLPPRGREAAPDRARRNVRRAGAAYVLSWLVGLALSPAAPAPDAAAAQVHRFYAEHAGAVVSSSLLVHGAAGLALGAFAVLVARATRTTGGLRRAVSGTGLAAAALSLAQVAVALVAALGVDGRAAGTSADLLATVNLLDVVKIACLAAFVAVATTAVAQARVAPPWLRALAGATVPLLLTGSAAFLVVHDVLTAALTASLLLLLGWAGSVAVLLGRPAGPRRG